MTQNTRNLRQQQILQWACRIFGRQTADNSRERVHRFAEEAIELAQAGGLTESDMQRLIEHVYAKPKGELKQEIGQVGLALLSYAEHLNISLDAEEQAEFERLQSLPADYWQSRQNAKADKGIALKSDTGMA